MPKNTEQPVDQTQTPAQPDDYPAKHRKDADREEVRIDDDDVQLVGLDS